jgi:hypothetical protein
MPKSQHFAVIETAEPAPVIGVRTALGAMVLSDVHDSDAFRTGGRSPRHLIEHARVQIGDVVATLQIIARDMPAADADNRAVLESLIARLA